MNCDRALPPGNDPLYAEFVSLWVASHPDEQNLFIAKALENEVKRHAYQLAALFFASLIIVIVVSTIYGQSQMSSGLQILLGIIIGLFLAVLAGEIMRNKN